jgi:hypothetical protein
MEYLKTFLHLIGFVIIYFTIDYKREKEITSLLTKQGWVIMFVIILAAILIKF